VRGQPCPISSFLPAISRLPYVLTCLVLLLVVLLQQGKGGDIASAFGGSSSQTAFGARSGATLLSRATAVCAALFMIGALALAVIGHRGTGSVVGSVPAPKPASAPASQPAKPGSTPSPAKPAPPPPASQPEQK
jgi:preprotein translocase subunit SecG